MNNKLMRFCIFLLLIGLLFCGCNPTPPVTEPDTTVADTTAPVTEIPTAPADTTTPVTEPTTQTPVTDPTEPVTDAPTQPATEKPTEKPTVPATEVPTTEKPTQKPTEPATEKPTEKPTEPTTEKPTVPVTEKPTEKPTKPATEKPTEPATEKTTQKPTEPTTEKPTEKPTAPTTEAPTEAPTEKQTEKPTEPTTEKPTEPTEPITQAPTTPATEPTTEPATEPSTPVFSDFQVHFIDVGQADAALVLCDGEAMLIDGGNAADSNLIFSYLKNHDVTHLNYVIGTHAHEDHIGGIAGALQYASVDTVYCPTTDYDSDVFENFSKAVANRGASITVPTAGTIFDLGNATCKIIAVNTVDDDPNNTSIVLRIEYGSTSFMFTGDAEAVVEQTLINRGETLQSTVLKVGHHGSSSSTSYAWLYNVMPSYAVISVGRDNSYGHPTESVLSRLRDADVQTFRTDMQGDILCTSDGSTVTFTVSRNAGADTFGGIGENSTEPPTETQPAQTHYILNTNSMKFHLEDCSAAATISDKNRQDYYGTQEELLEMGYSPCGWCDP